jgi:hypothetical protein
LADAGIEGWRLNVWHPGSLFFQKQTHQVIENIREVSGNGQNNPNIGHPFEG